jgi:hypothetical protein
MSERQLRDDVSLLDGKLLAFGIETCWVFPTANLAGR